MAAKKQDDSGSIFPMMHGRNSTTGETTTTPMFKNNRGNGNYESLSHDDLKKLVSYHESNGYDENAVGALVNGKWTGGHGPLSDKPAAKKPAAKAPADKKPAAKAPAKPAVKPVAKKPAVKAAAPKKKAK